MIHGDTLSCTIKFEKFLQEMCVAVGKKLTDGAMMFTCNISVKEHFNLQYTWNLCLDEG